MKTFFFTGTGNCLQVARGVGAQGEIISVPHFLRENENSSGRVTISADAVGIVFPNYWMALPQPVVEFLEKTRFETDYLFAINTRGNLSVTIKSHLLQQARKNGHRFSYYTQLNMPDNYVPMFDIAKEKQRFTESELAHSIEVIAADIQARKQNLLGFAGLSFMRPITVGIIAKKNMADFSQHFYVTDACNGCGTCTQVCSAQSLKLAEGKPAFGNKCNGCLACTHLCPANALRMHKEVSAERYLNPTVSVADIIAAHRSPLMSS